MAGWVDPRPNDFSVEGLRARFKSLQDWLSNPEFANGVRLGDGTPPTYDDSTGVTVPPTLTDVDAATLADMDQGLADLQADLDTLNDTTLPGLQQDLSDLALEVDGILPITEADISDEAITTPKLAANAVTAAKIAANTITANEIAAGTITANEIAADTITSNELAADAVTANELAALNIGVGKWIASTSYTPGSDGWIIHSDGTAEFNDVTVRGEVTATEFHGAPTENMLVNGDFETDTSGWAADTADYPLSTIARDTTQAHSGSASLRVQALSVGFAAAYTEIPVQPGDIIHMTAWVKKGAFHGAPNRGRNDIYVTMDFYDGATPIMMNGGTPFQVGTSWQFIERYVAVPANLTNVTHVRVGYASYAPSGSALYVDDVVVGKAPMMEIPYVVTNEDDSHLRGTVLPDKIGFDAPHSSYPYGLWAGEIGEGLAALDVRGPSLGPTAPIARLATDGSGVTSIALLADGVSVPSGRISFDGGNSSAPGLYFEGHPKAGVAYATSGGIAAPILVNENGYYSYVNSAGNGVFPHHTTTTAAANVFMTPNGALVRSTSSGERKKDIQTLSESVIDRLRPVTYRVKPEAAGEGDEPNRERVGFIAEEVAEADERLAQFDEDGKVTYFDMNGLVAHLVAEVQSLRKRVADLEANVDA